MFFLLSQHRPLHNSRYLLSKFHSLIIGSLVSIIIIDSPGSPCRPARPYRKNASVCWRTDKVHEQMDTKYSARYAVHIHKFTNTTVDRRTCTHHYHLECCIDGVPSAAAIVIIIIIIGLAFFCTLEKRPFNGRPCRFFWDSHKWIADLQPAAVLSLV